MKSNIRQKMICSIILFLFLTPGFLKAQIELDAYLKTAAENNPGLKVYFNEYMAAMEKVPQVGALPDPTMAFGYFISPIETRVGPQQFKVSATQMFPWFGLLNAREDVATQFAKSKFEIFEEARSRLIYEVKSTYYNFYFIKKAIEITKDNIEILQSFNQLALIKFEAGQASAVDELRILMEVSDLENQLAFLLDSKYEMQVAFNNLLNVPDERNIITPENLWDEELGLDRTQLMHSISTNNHRIRQIEHRILSWEEQETVARKTGMPNFVIGMDYAFIGKSSNTMLSPNENGRDAIMPMIGITIPLYRNKYKAMVNEAKFHIEAAGFEKEEKINQLGNLFETGNKEFRDGQRRVTLYQNQLKLAETALDILLAEYTTSGTNFEEVLRMERKVLKFELELDKAKADRNAAVAFVYYLMGN